MRTELIIASVLILFSASCTHDQDMQDNAAIRYKLEPLVTREPSPAAQRDLIEFNILQRTCALYVALRSSAWEGPVAFGREVDDEMVHWNMCPGGTMVACAKTPAANGDTVLTGIPWPY